ncbi:hypothetical protein E5D57_002430 [Metarhizium anisopliae]|nr:hypothetical protein E5D57_002430 [Metarhizium anisopliae]
MEEQRWREQIMWKLSQLDATLLLSPSSPDTDEYSCIGEMSPHDGTMQRYMDCSEILHFNGGLLCAE